MWRVVMRPALLRPPLLCRGRTSDFSGVDRVTSTKSATLEPRRPGVVGLYLRIPISQSSSDIGRSGPPSGGRTAEDVDTVALGEGHDRALGRRTLTEAGAGPLALALAVDRVDPGDLDREDRLHGLLDLGLVGTRVDDERVLVRVEQRVALLGHDRLQQDVTGVREGLAGDDRGGLGLTHQASFPSSSSSEATALADA